jgi:phenylacetate-CoA ligase
LFRVVRELRYAVSLLRGSRFDLGALNGLVEDLSRSTTREAGGALDRLSDGGILSQLADRRIRQTVQLAAKETPYYRHLFADLALDPDGIDAAAFREVVPVTAKETFRSRPADFISEQARPVLWDSTTGTTGRPTPVWFSHYELDLYAALSALGLVSMGVGASDLIVSCVSSRTAHSFVVAQRAAALVGAGFVQLGTVSPELILDRLRRAVGFPGKQRRPTHLVAPTSVLAQLVGLAEQEKLGPADFGLRALFTHGEILTDALRRRADEVFGAPCVEQYMSAEIAPVGGTVCGRLHLHMQALHGFVEVVDPATGTATAPGDVGMLTVTPFFPFRDTTLFLRYGTGDLVQVLPADEELDCELAALPATSRILGRMSSRSAEMTRAVQEALEEEREVPLPCRFVVDGVGDARTLHVVVRRRSAALASRLETTVRTRCPDVQRLVLVESPSDLPEPCIVRADLRETEFESQSLSTSGP